MARIQSVKEWRVWQRGMELAMRVFELSKKFPASERFSLTDQMRRSSRSVVANISEAWRKRRYQAAFISKLNDAEGEAAETQTWLELALRCRYMSPADVAILDTAYEELLAQLVHMITHCEDWTIPPLPK